MDMSKIQRALGVIEGVCIGLEDKPAEIIECAVCEIDCEMEAMPEKMDYHAVLRGQAHQNDNARKETPAEMHTTAEMDELVDRLFHHHFAYGEGHAQDYSSVCQDCKKAAEVITRLRLLIEDLEYAACVERP